ERSESEADSECTGGTPGRRGRFDARPCGLLAADRPGRRLDLLVTRDGGPGPGGGPLFAHTGQAKQVRIETEHLPHGGCVLVGCGVGRCCAISPRRGHGSGRRVLQLHGRFHDHRGLNGHSGRALTRLAALAQPESVDRGYRHHRAVRGHRAGGWVRRHPALLGRGGDAGAGADYPTHSGHGQGAVLRLRWPYVGRGRRPAPGRDGNVRRGQLRAKHGLDRRVLYRLRLRSSLRLLGRRVCDHGWDGAGRHELHHLLHSGPARFGACSRQRRAGHLPRGDPREYDVDNRRSSRLRPQLFVGHSLPRSPVPERKSYHGDRLQHDGLERLAPVLRCVARADHGRRRLRGLDGRGHESDPGLPAFAQRRTGDLSPGPPAGRHPPRVGRQGVARTDSGRGPRLLLRVRGNRGRWHSPHRHAPGSRGPGFWIGLLVREHHRHVPRRSRDLAVLRGSSRNGQDYPRHLDAPGTPGALHGSGAAQPGILASL
ncbi:MAG: Trk potassium uptake system protein TrkH, partial [uncultured Rubrobacteraceae bacterium]